MIDIKFIHVHWIGTDEKKHIGKLKPSDAQNTIAIKKDIADYVEKYRDKIEYYYVVIEIERADGKPAYRTIIPKTFPKKP